MGVFDPQISLVPSEKWPKFPAQIWAGFADFYPLFVNGDQRSPKFRSFRAKIWPNFQLKFELDLRIFIRCLQMGSLTPKISLVPSEKLAIFGP